MTLVILSLGSNIDPKVIFMDAMIREVMQVLTLPVLTSRFMETEPVEVVDKQDWYLNCIVSGMFDGMPEELLDKCKNIEESLHRVRVAYHGPRTADIDILAFGDCVMNEPNLTIPHPAFLTRRFCFSGAAEIAPDFIVPGIGISLKEYCQKAPQTVLNQKIIYSGHHCFNNE